MILRVRWILLTNGFLIEFGGPWPGPDGKPATIKGKDPETGKEKPYLLPATVGPIFFIKDESEGYPDEDDPDKQVGFGERAYYEVWADPANEEAADMLGGKFWSKAATRRLRISEQNVMLSEEEWPLPVAYKLMSQRSEELKNDYEDLDRLPMPKQPEDNSKPTSQEAAAPAV